MYYKSLSELSVLLGLARAGVTITEEDMMKKFEELKHQDIAFLIDEDRENEILKNTDEYYCSSNSDGTSSYELCTRVQISKENA